VEGLSSPLWVVLVTAPKDRADGLARALVEQRLAACVNVLPAVRSYYRWEGRLEEADEVLLLIKTTAAGYLALEDGVRALHPYDVPEVVALPASAVFAPYAAWVAENVGGAS
jgi:periplasmic divalent cation tolerance protein